MAQHKLVVLAFPPCSAARHRDGSLDSGDPRLRAGQAQLSLLRLADQGRLVLQDAVLVTRTDGASPFVEEIVDDHGVDPPARVGTEFWSAFFHALQALTDVDLEELKRAVAPDTTSLAVLASDVDAGELSFTGARVVVLDFGRCVDVVRTALHAPQLLTHTWA